MRQGESGAPGGRWTGPTGAGVSAPPPVVLPDLTRRFKGTAARLETLAGGHTAEAWLRFLAHVASAQHEAALGALACAQPLSWQAHLARILEFLADRKVPAEARQVMVAVQAASAQSLDEFANDFLHGEISDSQIGEAFYVAAALQVQMTAASARREVATVSLAENRGSCPCCDSTPVAGVIRAGGRAPGSRYLICSMCSTAWNHVRAVCIHCGEAGKLSLQSIEGDSGPAKAETCGHCSTYSKLLDERQDTQLDPVADDLASIGLDLLVTASGWSRHAPNPLLLTL